MKIAVIVLAGFVGTLVLLAAAFLAANWAPERSVAELGEKWAPPPSVFVDVAGMTVHLRDEGPRDDTRPIVLLHGTGSSLHAWQGWADALKDKRRVIRFDLPGFGLTGPSPDRDYSLDKDVALLFAVLDKLGVERCILGGNSLGGSVSLNAALTNPARVEKLILVDSGGYPLNPSSAPAGFLVAHIAAQVPWMGWLLKNTVPRSLVEQGMRNVFGDPSKVTPEMVGRAVALTQREGNRQALLDRFKQRRSGSLAQRIPELKLPTLIMWGGRDRLIPLANAYRFRREITGSTLVIFDDLGHAPEEEDPARTVVAVKQFLGVK
jgi:pimeloyl-ACP methyl ester carboxylesterase